MAPSQDIFSNQSLLVSSSDKENLLSHKGLVIWMTGYSGAGKTTLAYQLEKRLHEEGILTKVLDEDALRHGINTGLGFSMDDRTENIRRTAETAKLLNSCGVVVICSSITPTNSLRCLAENIIGEQHFILYHIATPLLVCENRDIRGQNTKANAGEIVDLTEASYSFETPTNAIYSIDTTEITIEESVDMMFDDIFPLITI